MILTVGRTVLHLEGADSDGGARFAADTDHTTTLTVEYGRWRDMGAPPVITVRIEPGDLLNA